MSLRRLPFLLSAFVLIHLSSASLRAQTIYTRNLYNHSSQSVVCTNPGPIICTMSPTTCLAGQSCTVAGAGFFTLTASAGVRWDFTLSGGTVESDTGTVTTTRNIYDMSRIDVWDITAGDFVSLSVPPGPIAENGGVATITAVRSAPSAVVTNVTLDINGGTAMLDWDFTQSGAVSWDGPLQRNVYTFQIPAGQTTGTLSLTSIDDSSVEPDETIKFRIYRVDTATWDGLEKSVSIDDDDRKVSLAVDSTSIPETGGSATVTVSVSPVNSAETVSVTLAFSGTATSPADYTRSATTINIPAGQSSATATISVAGDSLDEPDETIVIDVASVTNASENGTQQWTVTIVDDDVPQVTLQLAGSPFVENNTGVATVTARLDRASYQVVTVDLGFTGTATNGTDYAPSAASINIPIGSLTASMTLTGVPDTLDEPDETVIVDITTVTGAVESGTQQVTATIPDDDPPPAVTLSLAGSPFPETAGVATVTATLSTASAFPVTVDLAFGGSATNLADYTPSASSITIASGTLSGSITLTALDDTIDEPDETVIVDIVAATNATEAGTQQVTATITDDDLPLLMLSLAGSPIAESSGTATVTATLSTASVLPVTVDLGFSGTATNGTDYTRTATSINIPSGSLTGSVTLTAVSDTIDEPDETVIVDVTAVSGAAESGTQQVTATIADDDPPPAVTLSLAGSPFPENAGVATVTATLSAVSTFPVTVNLGFGGTATNAADYTPSASSITIDPGNLSGSITLAALDDAFDEPDETVLVDIVATTNATESGTQQMTATITDDDGPPLVNLSLAAGPWSENGGVAAVTATLGSPSSLPVTAYLGFSGSATTGVDYLASASSITIDPGNLSGSITLDALDDGFDEPDETVIVDILSVTNGIEAGVQQVTASLIDDDLPSVTLGLTGSPFAEAGGVATVTATVAGVAASAITVHLGFSGTATAADYTASATSITIGAGATTGSITISGNDDALYELNETVVVDVTAVDGGAIEDTTAGEQQVTATIADDETPPLVTLSLAGSPLAESGGTATVRALLSAPSGFPVTVTLGVTGSATWTDDYTTTPPPPISLVIPSGATEATATLTAVSDTFDETDETIVVDITGVINAIESGTQQVTATIIDDDAPPVVTLSLAGSPIAENAGIATVTATLSTPSALPVTVDLGFSGTAGSGVDYIASAPSITIPAGNLIGAVTLTALNDTIDETGETIVVDIAAVTNGIESGTQQVMATIADDDAAPAVTLSVTGSPIAESSGIATVTATLSTASAFPVTVDLGFGGTGTNGIDYTRSGMSITIPAGNLNGSMTLTAVNDAIDETDETIVVDVIGVTNGIESGTQQVIATITDDDGAPAVTLSVAGSPIAENAGIAAVTATLSAPSALPVTVNLGFSGTAGIGVDYIASAPSITIPAGNLIGAVTLTALNDPIDETDETIVVDIIGVTNGTESGTQQVTATITDDDAPPVVTLSLAGSPITENSGIATVTATLSTPSVNVVTVDLGFSGTATNGLDYARSGISITVSSGSLSGSVTLTALNDPIDETDETIVVDVVAVTNGIESGTQQVIVTITDDDAPPVVTLLLAGSPIAESSGIATVTVTLATASSFPVTVDLGFSGTATNGIDYTTTGLSITIPPASLSGSVTLTAVNDAIDETDETIVVDITGVTNGIESGTQQVTATIADDDGAPAVTLALAGSPMAEAGGVSTVTATLSRPSSLVVTVDLAFGGTATAADYSAGATAIVIVAGSTSGSITLTAVNDTAPEADETVVVDIAAVTNALESGIQQVTATITDDDPARLAFATQPSAAVAGQAIAPAVTIQVLDSSGRPVPASTASVTLTLGANPAGGTLSGTLTMSAAGGVATFANLVIDLSGAGYTLVANSSGLTPATSNPFEISSSAVTTFSGPSATGTGIVTVSFTGGGAACTFAAVSLLAPPPGADPLPPTSPAGLVFPHGLSHFELAGCDRGAAMTFTIVYPEALPEGTRYWKYGPVAAGAAPAWYELSMAAISGNRVTFTLTDGGAGDEDGLADGRLRDPGGPAFSTGDIPTLSEWSLLLMALMLASLGLLAIRPR